nr:immunoglobulin heavy chain junction region [Macaca mulatta]MOY23284.1 immunoglobulin heavy chain junction region [Macaca mulatta]MOY26350.1 immunoglobulin heavy chain junction region [Macaca mulatta]MOY27340.1 immunoglobulin heavy chain junction region [Macaca mulatta]MOY27861.1 immunoglobulin heavy chain junction region [Macaca mulatta]
CAKVDTASVWYALDSW